MNEAVRNPAEPIIEIENLSISFFTRKGEIPAVMDFSCTVMPGEAMGIVGESGCGKSTVSLGIMRDLSNIGKIVGGRIKFQGKDMGELSEEELRAIRGNKIAMIYQEPMASLNPAMKVGQQLMEVPLIHDKVSKEEAYKRSLEMVRAVKLPDPERMMRSYPHQLSGGQQQRIVIAMALLSKPALLLLDEPTTALDVTTQIDVLAAIKDAIRDTHVAALYITHDLAVVAQVSDEIMVLRHGRLVEWGGTRQIIKEPRQEYTNALVSVHEIEHQEQNPGATPFLSVKNVTAAYGGGHVKVLKNVSVDIYPGQTLAVVGESGSGKSTLARAITGLLPPEQGTVTFDGRPLANRLADRPKEDLRQLQMIYQMADVAMNPRQTVGTIIGRPLEFYFGMRGRERDKRVAELLDEIEMGKGFVDRYPAELSGGQKQRVCIARSLAAKPKLIICDEVTSALDPLVANGILKLLLNLQQHEKVAYLFITHDLATVKSIADSIAVMYRGEVVRYGSKSKVLTPPFDAYTDLLLSSVPEMEIGWLEKAIKGRRMASAGN